MGEIEEGINKIYNIYPFEVTYNGIFVCFKKPDGELFETGFTKEGLESIMNALGESS